MKITNHGKSMESMEKLKMLAWKKHGKQGSFKMKITNHGKSMESMEKLKMLAWKKHGKAWNLLNVATNC